MSFVQPGRVGLPHISAFTTTLKCQLSPSPPCVCLHRRETILEAVEYSMIYMTINVYKISSVVFNQKMDLYMN